MANPLVAILMGSANDEPLLEPTKKVLDDLGVPYVVRAMSAHRTPDKVREFAKRAESDGFEVMICAAGGAAHLPGAVAANCTLPVIGIPLPFLSYGGSSLVANLFGVGILLNISRDRQGGHGGQEGGGSRGARKRGVITE